MNEQDIPFDAAAALYREGRSEEAEAACRDMLSRSPEHARALHLLGLIRAAHGSMQEGLTLIRRALATQPDYAEAHFNLAAILASAGQPAEAAKHYAEVGRLRPDDMVAHIRHGAMLVNAGRIDDAIEQYRKILVRWPDCLPVMIELSSQYMARGAVVSALEMARRATELAPDNVVAVTRFGRALKQAGRMPEAIAEYRRALALDPHHLDALNFLAVALYEQGSLAEAETIIRRALARAPSDASSQFNAGMIAQSTGDMASATAFVRRAIDLAPTEPLYRRVFLTTALYDPSLDEHERASIHRDYGSQTESLAGPRPIPRNNPDPTRRLRIGWLSSDFRDHPVTRNIEPILSHYDRSAFEMYLYDEVVRPDEVTRRIRGLADRWQSTIGQSDREVAERIRADGIDILLLLAGRFDRNRPEIAAWRAAPIQVSFHDPATSGMSTVDYLIADRGLAPRGGEEWFSERVLALPTFYLHGPLEPSPQPGPLPMSERGHVTFGSFNHPAKVNDDVLRLWARLLHGIEGSRLVLKYRGCFAEAPLRERVQRAARDAGVEFERIDLVGEREDREVHLARYYDIDIALDPFPFSGSTTTFEAFWMGVPVVTLPGGNMASRWSAAMLRGLKLEAWIADSPEAYIGIASELARDAARLGDIRANLRERLLHSPLCRGQRRTRHMERFFRAMWRRWCAAQQATP